MLSQLKNPSTLFSPQHRLDTLTLRCYFIIRKKCWANWDSFGILNTTCLCQNGLLK